MIVVPMSSNSIYVSVVQTGCCKAEFDSTYPVHLNGIISQHEYRESIDRINRSVASNKLLIMNSIMFIILMSLGTIFYIVGGVKATKYDRYIFSSYFIAGIILTTVGSLLFAIGSILIQFRRASELQKAVAAESMRYSTRSPIPCSWRLEAVPYFTGRYRNQSRRHIGGHLVIDIGRPTIPGNEINYNSQDVNASRVFYTAPPPYSNQFTAICIHCGAVLHDPTANFCSSCGQASSKH